MRPYTLDLRERAAETSSRSVRIECTERVLSRRKSNGRHRIRTCDFHRGRMVLTSRESREITIEFLENTNELLGFRA